MVKIRAWDLALVCQSPPCGALLIATDMAVVKGVKTEGYVPLYGACWLEERDGVIFAWLNFGQADLICPN